jgi:hypothetical protein
MNGTGLDASYGDYLTFIYTVANETITLNFPLQADNGF